MDLNKSCFQGRDGALMLVNKVVIQVKVRANENEVYGVFGDESSVVSGFSGDGSRVSGGVGDRQ